MPLVQTVVYSKSSQTKSYGFLPPHGKVLAPAATYTFNGDIYSILGGNQRALTALSNALVNDLDVDVIYNEWRGVIPSPANTTVVNAKNNGRIFTTRGAVASITNVVLTTNVVTVTTSAAHSFVVGQTVVVAAVTNTPINGPFVIASVPSTTTFTYALTHGNISTGADTGTVSNAATSATITNSALTSNVVTITTALAHGLYVGQSVTVLAVTNTPVNTTATVATIPTPTTFTYAKTHADIGTSADTGTVSASGVVFTLPATVLLGQRWKFFNEANSDLVLAGPASSLVTYNNLTATSAAVLTASQKIGAGFIVEVNDNATKYLVASELQGQTVTVA